MTIAVGQDEENDEITTRIILNFTTTTLIPKTEEVTTESTTDLSNINFDTPDKVIAEIAEAFNDLSLTVNETLDNFNEATKDKLDDEQAKLFDSLEREELFNLYQDKCTVDDLTAYEEFQTKLNGVVRLWIDNEHPNIDKAFKQVFKDWITPFRRDVETTLVSPITSALRFPRGQLDKCIMCANQYVPQIIKLVESAFTNVLDCYNMSISYKETQKFADYIGEKYKQTAEKLTTCNQEQSCFNKVKEVL